MAQPWMDPAPHCCGSFVFPSVYIPSLCITINTSNSCLLYMKNVSGCTSKLQFFFVTNIVFQPYTGTKNRKAGVSFARIKRHTNFANRSACYSGSDKDNAVLTHEVNVRRLWLQYMHDASCTFIYQGYILGRILYIYLIYFISNWSEIKFYLMSCTGTVEGLVQILHAVFVES